MAREFFSVRIAKDQFAFCCGHFITYRGHQCERLHGHNYRAAVELEGGLDENRYVFDFIALKELMRSLVDELDHHMLVATGNPHLRVEADDVRVRVAHEGREWVFPRGDCVLLPIENTTAELLARHLTLRLLERLRAEHGFEPQSLAVEVEEGPGQSAAFRWACEGV